MSKIIVFEGTDEVLVGSADAADKIVTDWFLDAGRSLDDFDVYLADGNEGTLILTRVKLDSNSDAEHVDVEDVVSDDLRRKMIHSGAIAGS